VAALTSVLVSGARVLGQPVAPRRPDEGKAVMGNPLLFNPHTYDPAHLDAETRRLLHATIDFFEHRGKKALIDSYIDRAWYGDFLQFAAKEGLFATFLTPSADGGDDPAKRWDTARNAALSEILGLYGLGYWYTWQVTVLGLGPVWDRRTLNWWPAHSVCAAGPARPWPSRSTMARWSVGGHWT
jgi:hypothetical protein